MHEPERDQLCVLAGDFNARDGEDMSLSSEGWRDVWCEAPCIDAESPLSWTWRRGANSARYDRIYIHDGNACLVESLRMRAIEHIWGVLSDHVPLRVVVRRRARAIVDAPLLRVEAEVAFSTSVGNLETAQASTTTSCGAPLQREHIAQARDPIRVVEIANAITALDKSFCERIDMCMEHLDDADWTPQDVELGPEERLMQWSDVPTAGAFKTIRHGAKGTGGYASAEDRAAQARTYTQYTKWAQAVCNVSELEMRHYLETAAALPRGQRGVEQIPKALRGRNLTVRQHAVLRCRVECLRGYASVDVAKCVVRAQQELHLTGVTTV